MNSEGQFDGRPNSGQPESNRNSPIGSPFDAAVDAFATAQADMGLGTHPETGLVVSGSPSGDFNEEKSSPEAKMSNNGAAEDSPDGSGGGVGGDPNVEETVDAEVVDEGVGGDSTKEKKEKEENKYTWKEFSEKARVITDETEIDRIQEEVADELEKVGIRMRPLLSLGRDKEPEDLQERKRGARRFLDQVLNKIDNSETLNKDENEFMASWLGVSEVKLKEWVFEADEKNGKNEKDGSGRKEEPKPDDQNKTTESEEQRKQKLASEAHIALERLKTASLGNDDSDSPLFDAWVVNYGAHADQADYDEAKRWRDGIATRKQERIQREEIKKVEEERLKREREDRLEKEKVERERIKAEKEERERALRKAESDERQRIIDLDKAEKKRLSEERSLQIERDKIERRIRENAENEKRTKRQDEYKRWLDLRDELKLSLPSTRERGAWIARMKLFIADNEPIDGHQDIVNQAREKLKEAEAAELSFMEKTGRLILNSTLFLIPNTLNWLSGGRLYKSLGANPPKKN